MKHLRIIALFCLVTGYAFAQGEETLTTGNSANLQAKITALSSNGTIFIKGTITIDNSISVPSGIVIEVSKVGSFTIQNSKTLTINGLFRAGLYQVFTYGGASSAVVFASGSVKEISSEWFGDDDASVNKALVSATKVPVKISRNRTIVNAIKISSDQTLLINDGVELTASTAIADSAMIMNANPAGNTNITIRGGFLKRAGNSSMIYSGIRFENVSNSLISSVKIDQLGKEGAANNRANIYVWKSQNVLVENVKITGSNTKGLQIYGGGSNRVLGGFFKDCYDSGITADHSPKTLVDGAFVDHCGTSLDYDGASNMSLNSEYLTIVNCTSQNGPGKHLGFGMVFGHEGLSASYSVCKNNILINNKVAGVVIQGTETKNVLISGNRFEQNGRNNNSQWETQTGGVLVWGNFESVDYATNSHLIRENVFKENRNGIYLNRTKNIRIEQNVFNSDSLIAIQNEASADISSVNNVFGSTDYRNSLVASKDYELVTSASDGAQGIFTGGTNTNKRLIVGYDVANDYGIIHALEHGNTWGKNLVLQKLGGNVAIGNITPTSKLHVNGDVRANSFISATTTYADYVFEPAYRTLSIKELADYIAEHKHLPGIPTADDVSKKGLNLTEMNVLLLEKIEVLSLYVIELNKKLEEIENRSRRK